MEIVRPTAEDRRQAQEKFERDYPLVTTQQINSNSTKNKQPVMYAACGERVRLISDCGNVLIVEDPKGKRFPVRTDLIKNGND